MTSEVAQISIGGGSILSKNKKQKKSFFYDLETNPYNLYAYKAFSSTLQ